MEHSISWFGKLGNTHLFDFGRVQVWIHTGRCFRLVVGIGSKVVRLIL